MSENTPERNAESRCRRNHGTTLKDIAAATGLSVSTVSRALAKNPVIPSPTREIVETAARELKYRPNAQARALRNARTNIIGVLVPDIQNPYFSALTTAIQTTAQEKGYSMIIAHSQEDPKRLNQALEMLSRQRVDGIIVVPHLQSTDTIADMVDVGIPIVAADRTVPETVVPAVVSDPAPGITAALTALACLPNATIGYLAGPQDTSTGEQRLAAMYHAAADLDVAEPTVFYGGYQQELGRVGTLTLLDSGVNCILAGDSMMTIGALEAIHERNLRLSRDLALVGFDDTPLFSLQNPPLSIIDQHVELMGRRAFEMLYHFISTGRAMESVIIPTTFIPRGSSTLLTSSIQD